MNEHDFEKLVESVKQAGAIKRGTMQPGRITQFAPADIKSIRKKLDKSQAEFALMIGVSVSTLQNWEQGRRQPEGPACNELRMKAGLPSLKNEQADQKSPSS